MISIIFVDSCQKLSDFNIIVGPPKKPLNKAASQADRPKYSMFEPLYEDYSGFSQVHSGRFALEMSKHKIHLKHEFIEKCLKRKEYMLLSMASSLHREKTLLKQ